jgi:hypothetical protein
MRKLPGKFKGYYHNPDPVPRFAPFSGGFADPDGMEDPVEYFIDDGEGCHPGESGMAMPEWEDDPGWTDDPDLAGDTGYPVGLDGEEDPYGADDPDGDDDPDGSDDLDGA